MTNEAVWCKAPKALLARRDLSATAKLVYIALADRVGVNGYTWAGIRTIARDVGCCHGTVQRALDDLESAGLLMVERRGCGRSHHYRVVGPSALKNRALPDTPKRPKNPGASALKIRAQAPYKPERNYTNELDQTNQTKHKGRTPPASDWHEVVKAMTTDALKTDAFKAAWSEWCDYRRARRLAMTPITVAKQVKLLEAMGHDRAIEAIEASIRNGWQGLFPPHGRDTRPEAAYRRQRPYEVEEDLPDALIFR